MSQAIVLLLSFIATATPYNRISRKRNWIEWRSVS